MLILGGNFLNSSASHAELLVNWDNNYLDDRFDYATLGCVCLIGCEESAPASIPVPLALLCLGLAGLAYARRKQPS